MMAEMSPTPSTSTTFQSEDSFQSSDQSTLFSTGLRGDDCDGMDEDSETYFFESDHVALKGNPDYQRVLKSIALLEAQRIQAIKDLDKLYEVKQEAMEFPIQFVEKLQKRSDLGLPLSQKVPDLPSIEWEKYTSQLDFSKFGIHKHMTRLKKQLVDGNTDEGSHKSSDIDDIVRGKNKMENRSQTFNQLWNVEEQKRLEDLLIQFPPEEVESKRWQKIATALGNRTPTQVQSRVQKYFIKLARAGLPIPGRMPNMGLYKRKVKNKFQKFHKFYYQQSTFMHKYEPPVYMSDDDENSQSYEGSMISAQDNWENEEMISDEECVPLELRDSPEYTELMRLKMLRNQRVKSDSGLLTEHHGFKCDRCNCEPILGTRWHCSDCPPDVAVDFCDECVDCAYETETHNSSHRLKPKRKTDTAAGYQDSDYLGFIPGGNFSGYNYLDPNYMPAS